MRALFVIILIIAAVVFGGWWLTAHHSPDPYAPREAQDTDLANQPAPEPTPPPPAPTDFKTSSSATLPNGPIPYDQLNKQGDAAATDPNGTPPEKKSNDKAIFY